MNPRVSDQSRSRSRSRVRPSKYVVQPATDLVEPRRRLQHPRRELRRKLLQDPVRVLAGVRQPDQALRRRRRDEQRAERRVGLGERHVHQPLVGRACGQAGRCRLALVRERAAARRSHPVRDPLHRHASSSIALLRFLRPSRTRCRAASSVDPSAAATSRYAQVGHVPQQHRVPLAVREPADRLPQARVRLGPFRARPVGHGVHRIGTAAAGPMHVHRLPVRDRHDPRPEVRPGRSRGYARSAARNVSWNLSSASPRPDRGHQEPVHRLAMVVEEALERRQPHTGRTPGSAGT